MSAQDTFTKLSTNIITQRPYAEITNQNSISIFVGASVRPSEFVRNVTCTIMHGFLNNLTQLLPLRWKNAF